MPQQIFRLSFNPQCDLLTETLDCELDVLNTWYGDTRELLAQEFGPYADHTVFVTVQQADESVVGFCRLICPGPRGLKTLNDIRHAPWQTDTARSCFLAGLDPRRTWDVATLGVRRELGATGRVVAAALYYGSLTAASANDIPRMVSILDSRVRRLLQNNGAVYHSLPGTGPAPYLGSPSCEPVHLDVAEVIRSQRVWVPSGPGMIRVLDTQELRVPRPETFRLPPESGPARTITLPDEATRVR